MMSGDDVLMMSSAPRVEVFTATGRRRRWSLEQKARIIQESYATSVGEAAARYGVSKSQLFNWRRERRGVGPSVEFATVEVGDLAFASPGERTGVIEIMLGGARVRLGLGVDPQMATTVIMALRASLR